MFGALAISMPGWFSMAVPIILAWCQTSLLTGPNRRFGRGGYSQPLRVGLRHRWNAAPMRAGLVAWEDGRREVSPVGADTHAPRDQRRCLVRRFSPVRSRAAVCLPGLRQARRRRAAGLQLEGKSSRRWVAASVLVAEIQRADQASKRMSGCAT